MRKKIVNDSGLADLYENLMVERARRIATERDDSWFGLGYRLVNWLQSHAYKYPAKGGETAEERELGYWVSRIRRANRGSSKMRLDHRRRMFLRAINFQWTGIMGWKGTIGRFPDNWEEHWEELVEDEEENENETENNGETD